MKAQSLSCQPSANRIQDQEGTGAGQPLRHDEVGATLKQSVLNQTTRVGSDNKVKRECPPNEYLRNSSIANQQLQQFRAPAQAHGNGSVFDETNYESVKKSFR